MLTMLLVVVYEHKVLQILFFFFQIGQRSFFRAQNMIHNKDLQRAGL